MSSHTFQDRANGCDAVVPTNGGSMPQQPLSGITVVAPHSFGAGSAGQSPEYVCIVKKPVK